MQPDGKSESPFVILYTPSSSSSSGATEPERLPYRYRGIYRYEEETKESTPEAISLDAIGGVKKIPSKLIKLGEFLGNGAFGKVHKGDYNGKPVAIKFFNGKEAQKKLDLREEEAEQAFDAEVSRLATLQHPDLPCFYGLCEVNGQVGIVMEYCDGGNLEEALKSLKELSWATRLQIALEVTQALSYMHKQGVLHRDLKTENVLLHASGKAMLADFGVARVDPLVQAVEAVVVTKSFKDYTRAAPEEFSTNTSSAASDVFSLGIFIWQLVTRKPLPYEDLRGKELADVIMANKPLPLPPDCPQEFRDLIAHCMKTKPEDRHTMQDVLQSLETMFKTIHPQPAAALLMQRTDMLLNEHRQQMEHYLSPYTTSYPINEDPDVFWQRLERTVALAATESKEEKRPEKDVVVTSKPTELQVPKPAEPKPKKKGLLDIFKKSKGSEESKKATEELKQEAPQSQYAPQPIEQTFKAFLENPDKPVFVALGDGGLGKSLATFCWADGLLAQFRIALAKKMAAHPNSPIELPDLVLPVILRPEIVPWTHSQLRNGLTKALKPIADKLGIPIEALKKARLLFILDGYDELQFDEEATNLPELLGLAECPNAKLAVTCRPKIVPEGKMAERFGFNKKYEVHYLLPSSFAQMLIAFEQRLQWTPEERLQYEQRLNEAPELRAVLRNPFIRHLFIQSWPVVSKKDFKKLKRVDIYECFVEHWLASQQVLLADEVIKQLQGGTPPFEKDWQPKVSLFESFQAFASTLALNGFERNQLSLDEATCHRIFANSFLDNWLKITELVTKASETQFQLRQQQLKKSDQGDQQRMVLKQAEDFVRLQQTKAVQFMKSCSFKQSEGQIGPVHKTTWENYVAGYLHAVTRKQDTALITPALNNRDVQEEPGVMDFWVDYLLRDADDGTRAFRDIDKTPNFPFLLERVKVSATDPDVAQASANAYTILNRARASFNYLNLPGIRIPGADASYSMCEGIRVPGGDFSGVTMSGGWFRNGDFENTNMPGVKFGWSQINLTYFIEYQPLKFPHHYICCHYSPDGQSIAVGGDDCIMLLDSKTNKVIWEKYYHLKLLSIFGEDGRIQNLNFSRDGKYLAIATGSRGIFLMDVKTGKLKRHLQNEIYVYGVTFHPDNQYVTAGGWEPRKKKIEAGGFPLCTWKTNSFFSSLKITEESPRSIVRSIDISSDGKWIVTGSSTIYFRYDYIGRRDNKLWRERENRDYPQLKEESEHVDNVIRLWEVTSGRVIHVYHGHTDGVWSVKFSPDGKLIASGSVDKTIALWSLETKQQEYLSQGHSGAVRCVAFNHDGQYLASGSDDTSICIWDVLRKQLVRVIQGHQAEVESVDFNPSENSLVSASRDGTLRIWGINKEQWQPQNIGHTGKINCVIVSPNKKQIITCGADKLVCIWEAKTGQLWQTLQEHSAAVESVVLSSSGRYFASVSDKTAYIWENVQISDTSPPSWKLTHRLQHPAKIDKTVFNEEDTYLITTDVDCTLRWWNIITGEIYYFSDKGSFYLDRGFDKSDKIVINFLNSKYYLVISYPFHGTAILISVYDLSNGYNVVRTSKDGGLCHSVLSSDSKYFAIESISQLHNEMSFMRDNLKEPVELRNVDIMQLVDDYESQPRKCALLNPCVYHSTPDSTLNGLLVFSPKTKWFATVSGEVTIILYEQSDKKHLDDDKQRWSKVGSLQGHSKKIHGLAFSPDEKLLASYGKNQHIYIWELATKKRSLELITTGGTNNIVWLSGDTLLATGDDNALRCWKWNDSHLSLRWVTHQGSLTSYWADFTNAKGLSESNRNILETQYATVEKSEAKPDEEKHSAVAEKQNKPTQVFPPGIARQLTCRHSIYAPLPVGAVAHTAMPVSIQDSSSLAKQDTKPGQTLKPN